MENATKGSERNRIWRSIIISAIIGILAAGIVIYKNSHKDAQPTLKQKLQEKKTKDSLANQIQ